MAMMKDNLSIWQLGGGPASRPYADVFLKHGVGLIGPGDAGAWKPERDDDEFEGGFVRRFVSEMQVGDVAHGYCHDNSRRNCGQRLHVPESIR